MRLVNKLRFEKKRILTKIRIIIGFLASSKMVVFNSMSYICIIKFKQVSSDHNCIIPFTLVFLSILPEFLSS
jgi:hypothetical protein